MRILYVHGWYIKQPMYLKKVLIFRALPPKMPLVMDSPPSKPLCTAPYKQQVHWLFYVPAMDI